MKVGFIGLGLMLPSAAAAARLFNAMIGAGMGEEDSSAVLNPLELGSERRRPESKP